MRRAGRARKATGVAQGARRFDAVELEVFHHRLAAVADEMGVALCRSAFSANIKERRDFSCAVFDAQGRLAAHAAHIPVHLGSTPLSVQAAIDRLELGPGDVAVLNDPFAGGTHLPDVTVVAPVFHGAARVAYVANRAHHADIGGAEPGSMALAREIYQEGFRIPPVRLCRKGRIEQSVVDLFLANTRVPEERRGDLEAQLAALRVGERRLRELCRSRGPGYLADGMAALQDYAERMTRAFLRRLPGGEFRAEDVLDDDGFEARDIRIAVRIRIGGGTAQVDFTGTDPQVRGGLNANLAVTLAATWYAFKLLLPAEVPPNAGFMRCIRVTAPAGSVVNARFPAAVAGGNVETSQRVVDVVLRALAGAAPERVPAASAGTMSNLAIGGWDPERNRSFSYYETIAGGAGAGPGGRGESAIQTHMTNTMNTPIEALEADLPLRVVRYAIRRGSGGTGLHRGGDGLIRELEPTTRVRVSILGERRRRAPWGLQGGGPGRPGRDEAFVRGRWRRLPSKATLDLDAGGRLRIVTPGGGGWGHRRRRP